ncbi:MAG: hypothetical protein JXA14_19235 [Anaerolineae bacterium]|nr:hypothetical protein [Anaerolineae bacterium]
MTTNNRIRLTAYQVPGRNGTWVARALDKLFLVEARVGDDARVSWSARVLDPRASVDDALLASQAVSPNRVQNYSGTLPRATREEIKRVVEAAAARAEAEKRPPKQYVVRMG